MKSFILVTAAALLTFTAAPFVAAQETETPTSAGSATPSASSESTNESAGAPKTYPTPGVGGSPAASSTKASAKSSPAAAGKASPAAKTSAAPAATPVALKGNAEAQIKQIENLYEEATMKHNIALVEPFLADDLVFTDTKNQVMNRRTALAEFKKDTDTYTTAKTTGVKVRMVAPNTAVVTGQSHEAGKDKSGQAFDRSFVYTDTFVNRNGKWVVVATHASKK